MGLLLVIAIFAAVARLTRIFIRRRSMIGGLLVANLVYWLAISNFLVYLEFPYTAISFWSFFGITWVYALDLQSKKEELLNDKKIA